MSDMYEVVLGERVDLDGIEEITYSKFLHLDGGVGHKFNFRPAFKNGHEWVVYGNGAARILRDMAERGKEVRLRVWREEKV